MIIETFIQSQNTTATDGLAENENAKPKDKPERRWIPIWLQVSLFLYSPALYKGPLQLTP